MDLWKKVLRSELSLLGRNLWKNLWFYHQVPEGQPPKKTRRRKKKIGGGGQNLKDHWLFA